MEPELLIRSHGPFPGCLGIPSLRSPGPLRPGWSYRSGCFPELLSLHCAAPPKRTQKLPECFSALISCFKRICEASYCIFVFLLCFLCSTLFCSSPILLYEVYVQFHCHSVSQKDYGSPLLLMNIWVVCTWGLF